MSSSITKVTNVTTINNLPDELLRLISISAGSTEYCNFRRAMKRVWLYTTGREDHCIKHFLVTKINKHGPVRTALCGKRHNMFDKPASIWPDGAQWWYQHGKRHRDNDRPAYIHPNGTQHWYRHGERHRDNDQPAVIGSGEMKMWYQYGVKYTP